MPKLLAILTALLCLSPSCFAGEPLRLTPAQLGQIKGSIKGEVVEVDGCIYVHHHGMQVGPCGDHTWHQITSATDPENLLPAAFASLKRPSFGYGSFRAVFIGRMVDEEYQWPKHGIRPSLQLVRIEKVRANGP